MRNNLAPRSKKQTASSATTTAVAAAVTAAAVAVQQELQQQQPTYQELKRQGYKGTKYDAEMMLQQGLQGFLQPNVKAEEAEPMAEAVEVQQQQQRRSRRDAATAVAASSPLLPSPPMLPSSSVTPAAAADLTVTVRSLRSTPGRLRAR